MTFVINRIVKNGHKWISIERQVYCAPFSFLFEVFETQILAFNSVLASTSTPSSPPALNIYAFISSTTTHCAALQHLTDVLGLSLEISLCKQSSLHSASLSDSTPSASPSIHLCFSLSSRHDFTHEHAACGTHSLASETLDIFNPEQIHTSIG